MGSWIRYDGDERVHLPSHRLTDIREAKHLMLTPCMTARNPTMEHPQWPLWYQNILVTARPLVL